MQAKQQQTNEARENVYQFNKGDQKERQADEIQGALRDMSQPKTQQRGRFLRFLYWTQIMQDTNSGDGKLNTGFLFVIGFFFFCLFAGFVGLCVIFGFFYLDMKEDFRGDHAWQDKYVYDNFKKLEKDCQEAVALNQAYQKLFEQNKLKVPPELLKLPDCKSVNPNAEKPTTGEH